MLPKPDTAEISRQIDFYTDNLHKVAVEMHDFIESEELPKAEVAYDEAFDLAIAALEDLDAKQTTIKEKAKKKVKDQRFELLKCKMKWQGFDKRVEIYRTIISAKKAQLGVQDIV